MKKKRYFIFMETLIVLMTLVSLVKEPEGDAWKIMLIGWIGSLFLLKNWKRIEQKQLRKEREKFFESKYPMLAGNVSLLLQSGMSPKSAFLYMEQTYEGGDDPLKKELGILKAKLVSGYGESAAYREFGEACMRKEYRRLMSLVIQYLEQGTKFLVVLLELEMREASKSRLRQARQEGERISTKMLLPIGLLFLVVIMIVIAPIMSSLTALQGL